MEHRPHVDLTDDIWASFAELEGEGVDDVQQEILHGTHEPLNALRLRDRDLVLPRTWGTTKVDFAWTRWVLNRGVIVAQHINLVAVPDDFSTLCFVRADLSPLTASARAATGEGGKKYWTIVFSIEIHFGLTEFKARIKWTDDVRPVSVMWFWYGLS